MRHDGDAPESFLICTGRTTSILSARRQLNFSATPRHRHGNAMLNGKYASILHKGSAFDMAM